jgi:hypothetical protein
MRARRDTGASGAREILQVLIVASGWIGFVWLWVLVGRQPWDSSRLLWLIAGSFVVLPLVTLAWVIHNRAIFRRKGERLGVPEADFSYRNDWHGRRVDADWATLRASRYITIGVEGDVKAYRATGIDFPDEDAAANDPATHPQPAFN